METNTHVTSNFPNYKTTRGLDEETNNGPLDFSLNKIPDLNLKMEVTPLPESLVDTPLENSKSQRIKLTLRETPEQREKRLREGRERMRRLRANESLEEREQRLVKARECQERRRSWERLHETDEEREKRLSIARERTRLRRSQETPDQREKRLKATRERLRLKRSLESQDERLRRLQRHRDKKQGKVKLEEELDKRQTTRGILIKYNLKNDIDDTLLHLQGTGGGDMTWVTEPEVCLSVETSQNMAIESNTNTTMQVSYSDATTVPTPQDLQNQISQHVSNLVLQTDTEVCSSSNSSKQKLSSAAENRIVETRNCQQDTQHTVQQSSFQSSGNYNNAQQPIVVSEICQDAPISHPPDRTTYQSILPSHPSSEQNTFVHNSNDNFVQSSSSNYSFNASPQETNASSNSTIYSQSLPKAPLNLQHKAFMFSRYNLDLYENPRNSEHTYSAPYHAYSTVGAVSVKSKDEVSSISNK